MFQMYNMRIWFIICFLLFTILSHSRQALFGDHVKKPQSLEDTDLSRLYTATSLMQIDDNVMRCAHAWGWGARWEVASQHCPARGLSTPTLVLRGFCCCF